MCSQFTADTWPGGSTIFVDHMLNCPLRRVGFALASVLFVVALRPAAQNATATGPAGFPLYGPDNVVVAADGIVFVTDTDHVSHHRILKLSPQGKIVTEWHLFAPGTNKSNGPEGITLDSAGNIYVADQSSNQVLKLSQDGKVLFHIGGGAKESAIFHDLGHVAVDGSGHIFVSEGGANRIQEFSGDGRLINSWTRAKGSRIDQFLMPESIVVDKAGNLYVEDWGNRRIVKLSSSGETLLSFGSKGSAPGQFMNSAGLAIDAQDNIYVPDTALHRIQMFSPTGALLLTISNPAGGSLFLEGPSGIAVDKDGNLHAPDGKAIVKLSPRGKLLARWQ